MGVYDVHSGSQPQTFFDVKFLSEEARRLILGSMLRWIVRRYRCGQPVLREELLRIFAFADDAGREDVSRA
jgi:hypothetical protein